MNNSGRAFAAFTRRLGGDVLLTQGAGGNTAAKFDDGRMAVKASGIALAELGPRRGWVWTDLAKLRRGLAALAPITDEAERQGRYRRLLEESVLVRSRHRVSIETSTHALLPQRWTAHVHSVAGELLGQMPEAEARPLAEGAARVEVRIAAPASPGVELGKNISQDLAARPSSPKDTVLWILQNHGLVWAAPDTAAILRTSSVFERALRAHFELDQYPLPTVDPVLMTQPAPAGQSWHRMDFRRWPHVEIGEEPLFPDFAGHFHGGARKNFLVQDGRAIFAAGKKQAKARGEVVYAHALIGSLARKHGWYRALPADKVRTIQTFMLERPAAS